MTRVWQTVGHRRKGEEQSLNDASVSLCEMLAADKEAVSPAARRRLYAWTASLNTQ